MKVWLRWSLVTVIVGAVVFALTPSWPIPPTAPPPPSNVLPLVIVLSLIESLSFGLGVAFLIFGSRARLVLRQPGATKAGARLK